MLARITPMVSETGVKAAQAGNVSPWPDRRALAKVAWRQENNAAAALPANLPYPPLGWGAITMFVERRGHASGEAYPAGATLALVTWA